MKMVDHRIGTFLSLRFGVDKIITVSRFLERELVKSYKIAEKTIHVIYNSIDTQKFNPHVSGDPIRRQYGLDDKPVVLYLGRLAPYKGIQLLVKAIPLILRQNPATKFLIAGSRRYDMLNLPEMAESLGVSKSVIFTGYVPDEMVPQFYACCDVFCYPSQWEGFGLPVAEAGATGKPVVACKMGAMPEVIQDGVTGLLVPSTSTQLANAVCTLLENAELRKKMGQEARKKVSQQFSRKEMVQKTLQVYKEVM
jgi:glycosyltransferase involved in cell wall biosynthesis